MLTWTPPPVKSVRFKGKKNTLEVGKSGIEELRLVGDHLQYIEVVKKDECYLELISKDDKVFLDGRMSAK